MFRFGQRKKEINMKYDDFQKFVEKWEIIKYLVGKTKLIVCGKKAYYFILRQAGTILPQEFMEISAVKHPNEFDAVYFSVFWLYSDLVPEWYMMPLELHKKLLKKELKTLEKTA